MSGAFRRLLGPAKARLYKYINDCPPFDRLYDENLSKQENLTALHKVEYEIRFHVQKINRPIEQIREQQRNWADLIERIDNDDDKKTEEDLYSEQLQAGGAFAEVDTAFEKVAELETVLKEIEQLRQMLYQGILAPPSAVPPTTVSGSPNAFGAVSQAWSPGPSGSTMPPSSVPMTGIPVCTATAPTTVTTTLGPMSNVTMPSMSSSGPPPWTPSHTQPAPAVSAPAGQPFMSGAPGTSMPAMSAPMQFGVPSMVPPTQGFGGLTQPPAATPAAFFPDQRIRLPKMDLPTYNGDPFKWLEFWDVFCSSVHHQTIPNVTKFQYLKSLLRGPASAAIAGMAVTNDNYNQALQIIHHRFGDTSIIKDALYNKLQSLTISGNKPNDVRFLADSLERTFRQLQSLGEDIAQPYFLHLIYGKLSSGVLADLERMKPPLQPWTVETLRNAIWDFVRINERIQRATRPTNAQEERPTPTPSKPQRPAFKSPQQDRHKQKFARSSTESFAAAVNKNSHADKPNRSAVRMMNSTRPKSPCVFCNEPHYHADCNKFKSLDSRRKRLAELQRCFLCFREGHYVSKCDSPKRRCPHCQTIGKHNRALCPQRAVAEGGSAARFAKPTVQQVQPAITSPAPDESGKRSETVFQDTPVSNTASPVGLAVNNVEIKQTKKSTQLMTARTLIMNPNNDEVRRHVHLFMDCGSQRTFITKSLADQMRLPVVNTESLQVYTFAASSPQNIQTNIVALDIMYSDGTIHKIYANTVPNIIGKQQKDPLSAADIACLEKIIPTQFLCDFSIQASKTYSPDILIGLDYFWDIIEPAQKIQLPSGLHVIPSKFGFLLAGPHPMSVSTSAAPAAYPVSVCTEVNQSVPELVQNVTCTPSVAHPNIEDFWSLEAIGVRDNPYVNDDDVALHAFTETIKYEGDRYHVKWPWKPNHLPLPDDFGLAMGRFRTLQKRFQMDEDLLQKYDAIIHDQLQKGVVEIVTDDTPAGPVTHYLPHHPVITPQRQTTKVRLVYDASAKAGRNSPSLNECLYRGPVLLPDLCGMLIRFRLHPIAIIADVEKAFLQIGLQLPDRDVTRFIWFQDAQNPQAENNLQVMRFCRIPFGVISSPFLLEGTIDYHLQQTNTPVANKLRNNIYIDNVCTGVDTVEDAVNFYSEAKQIFSKAALNLREWTSNNQQFREQLPTADQISTETAKVLGVPWSLTTDTLSLNGAKKFPQDACTKREVLHSIASLFDPLGWVTPVTMTGKLFLQQLWKLNYDWDTPLTDELHQQWGKISHNYGELSTLTLDRFIGTPISSFKSVQLHAFVDASQQAYATCVYLRVTTDCDAVSTTLLFAKSRLAPKTPPTIPRLELMAILIGTRALSFVQHQLPFPINDCFVWTDSICCLRWLATAKPLSVFVENRLREIKSKTDIKFQYVPSAMNPADCATRGLTTPELQCHGLWWNGPSWLKQERTIWPSQPEHTQPAEDFNAEVKNSALAVTTMPQKEVTQLIDETKISSMRRLLRITCYCFRFLKLKLGNKLLDKVTNDMLKKVLTNISTKGPLTSADNQWTTKYWVQCIQHKVYGDIIAALHTTATDPKEQLISFVYVIAALKATRQPDLVHQLGIYFDADGLLRCRGRLKHAELATTNPALLPPKEHFTKLLIQYTHSKLFHAGVRQTLAELRKQFWIPCGRLTVRNALSSCTTCRKVAGGPYKLPHMPPLPIDRVHRTRPFENIGLDYLGHIWVKKTDANVKAWICLFTCLATRAIHLEMVFDMSALCFLNALRRFIARRGKPAKIISDNASQFKLTERTLTLAWNQVIQHDDVVNYCSNEQINWHFIPERAPWQGGIYERLVGLVKSSLKRAVGKKMLTTDELLTFTTEVEAVVNSRPLTFVYEDIDSKQVLCPSDFISSNAQIGTLQLEEDHQDEQFLPADAEPHEKLLQTWKWSQNLLDKFWKIWYEDYLQSLRERTQTTHKQGRILSHEQPSIDDVVLIKEENLPRGLWKLARITKLNQSGDGLVRSAELLLPNKHILTRPLSLLFPVEVNTPHSAEAADMQHKDDKQKKDEKDKPKDEQTSSSKSTTPHRYNTRSKSKLMTMLTIVFLAMNQINTTFANQCTVATNDGLQVIQSHYCVSTGIVIYKQTDGSLCWLAKTCPTGHLDGFGHCKLKCYCPSWAQNCAYYRGPVPAMVGDEKTILASSKPDVCSFEKDLQCNPEPTHGKLNRIQLYSNDTYYVAELQIEMVEPNREQYECIGDGIQTGTVSFCEKHDCSSHAAKKFCYYRQNEIAYFVTQDGKLPIRAWGTVPTVYYGPKHVPPENPSCLSCDIQCIQGGARLTLDENVGLMEICSKPYCYKLSHPRPVETVMFPPDINLYTHDFVVKLWSNGYQIKEFGKQCPAKPFCETIDCYICMARLFNPQCAPKFILLMVFIAIYFGSTTLYFSIKLLKSGCKTCYYISYFCFHCMLVCKMLLRRARQHTYSHVILPVYSLVDDRDDTPGTTPQQDTTEPSMTRSTYAPRMPDHTVLSMTVVVTVFCCFGLTTGCSEVTTLTAQQTVCSVGKGGIMECVLTETTRLALVPQGQDTCLLIRDPNGEPLGTIALEVEKITLSCQMQNEYFTRSFAMKAQASKRCANAGSCTGEKCSDVTLNSKLEELDGEANESPGFTYCSESCGCAGCGCFYCTYACLFYRTYAHPVSDTVYEVFSYPIWQYNVQATARITLQDRLQQHSFDLKPGVKNSWNNLKLTLISVTNPPVPILGSQFLTDGTKTLMVKASASGQPVSGTVGEIQCSNKAKAAAFDCYLPHDACDCQPHGTKISCACSERSLEPLFDKIEYVIPLETQGLFISGHGTALEAEFNDIASLEVQVSLEGFRLATKVDKNRCVIKTRGFGGCYACLTGAKLSFTCTTDHGEALAHVTCGAASFSTICTPQGVEATATLNFPNAHVSEQCIVRCPAGETKFSIETTLVFIDKERLGTISNVIAGKNNAGEFDLGFLANWLSGNWLAGIIIIIIVVLLLAITCPMAPLFLNNFTIYMTNIYDTLYKKCRSRLRKTEEKLM